MLKIIKDLSKAFPALLAFAVLSAVASDIKPAYADTDTAEGIPDAQLASGDNISDESPDTQVSLTETQEEGDRPVVTSLNVSTPSDETVTSVVALETGVPDAETPLSLDAPSDTMLLDDSASLSDLTSLDELNAEPSETTPSVAELDSIGVADNSMAQVTSVYQLSDVSPTDWAFQALQSLVERYGCIQGYPDGTFRGNRPITRYEFAAGLNACLDSITTLLPVGITDTDISAIQRLQQEFAAELATLRGRVDSLEARAAEVEANQFSTTTKLFGQVVMGLQARNDYEFDSFVNRFENDSEPNIISNVQLSFLTQFDSRSLLLIGLQAGDGGTSTGTPGLNTFTGLGYEGDTDFSLEVSDLSFRHLLTRDFAVIVGPEGLNAANVFRGSSRVESAGFGPLSRFAQRNPIISIGAGQGGVGFDWQVSNHISLQGVYTSSNPGDPEDAGLFGGDNGVTTFGTQLVVSPSADLDLAFQYINSYSPFGQLFTGVGDDLLAVRRVGADGNFQRTPMQTDAFGAGLEWRVTRNVTLGGWFGFTDSELTDDDGSVETTNWMAYVNFPDLFGEGNVGGIFVGQPPKITNSNLPDGLNIPSFVNDGDVQAPDGGQDSSATHVEVFYRWRLSDHITLTPGVIVIFNPGHNDDNDTVVIGGIRTTFTF
jgi:hypothetical protein